jgi:acetylornithine/succinyldiaminopimelate/putrescine aminotransferase
VRDSFDIDAHVKARGAQLREGLGALANRFPKLFGPVRGAGLMLGLPLNDPYIAKSFADAARTTERLLVNAAGNNTLRFVPPLLIDEAQISDALVRLERVTARIAV